MRALNRHTHACAWQLRESDGRNVWRQAEMNDARQDKQPGLTKVMVKRAKLALTIDPPYPGTNFCVIQHVEQHACVIYGARRRGRIKSI